MYPIGYFNANLPARWRTSSQSFMLYSWTVFEQYEMNMESLDYWRLCEDLTTVQAAILVSGGDPKDFDECGNGSTTLPAFHAAYSAICSGLRRKSIQGQEEINSFTGETQFSSSRVEVESLKSWLRSRGFTTGFFFPADGDLPEYLDPTHERYAPKLAAAVRAWMAVTDCGKTSPKKALEKWLREHAAEYGMTDADGNPATTPIDDCSKIANWQPSGGAPKSQ